MSEHEPSPWAPKPEKPALTHEEAYADALKDNANIDDMRMITSGQAERAEPLDGGPALGETFLVKRTNGEIEMWTVGENLNGEKVLESTENGVIIEKPLRDELITPEAQQALAQELRVREAQEAVDNLRLPFGDKRIAQISMPAPREKVPEPPHEPYVEENPLYNARGPITVIDPDQPPATKKTPFWKR